MADLRKLRGLAASGVEIVRVEAEKEKRKKEEESESFTVGFTAHFPLLLYVAVLSNY